MSKYEHIKQEAFEANMQLPKLGLVFLTFGNASAAERKADVFAIKPGGVPYDELSPEKMVIVDFDGNVIEGNLRPSSDTKTHAVLYKNWAGIKVLYIRIPPTQPPGRSPGGIYQFTALHMQITLPFDIPCANPMDDEAIQGDYEYETGCQIINCLAEKGLNYTDIEMVLVGNHAPFTWGKTAAKAVYNSAVLESAAQMTHLTEQINPKAGRLKASLIKKHFERKHGPNSYYGQS
jgi:L-ribulose-5-phosphate 4-epimerase